MNKLSNNRGSILAVSVIAAAVFMVLSQAMIMSSVGENTISQRYYHSTRAFWLADGAIQVAKTKIPPTEPVPFNFWDNSDTSQTYNATVNSVSGYLYRWQVNATGTVTTKINGQPFQTSRTLVAQIAELPVQNAVETNGTINGTCSPTGSAQIDGTCEANANITLQNVFGLTYTNNRAMPTPTISIYSSTTNYTINHSYTDANYQNAVYSGLTVITSTNANGVDGNKIATTGSNTSFLIVDCSPNASPCVKFVGNTTFNGIIWVRGSVSITGTPNINGALFVEGSLNDKLSGDGSIQYDESNIYSALNLLGGLSLKPTVISWSEL